jgi:hypothetical protein
MIIGLIPMAAKPYHAGHDGLVRIAAGECDVVKVYVSTTDRARPGEFFILGSDMIKIWTKYLEPSLPENVEVEYVNVPVTAVYSELEKAEAEQSLDTFVIYSDVEDITKYKDEALMNSAPEIYEDGRLERRGVERSSTVDVSGTAMRQFLSDGDMENFVSFLPPAVMHQGQKIFDILYTTGTTTARPEKKKSPAKANSKVPAPKAPRVNKAPVNKLKTKKIKKENILREYIEACVRGF